LEEQGKSPKKSSWENVRGKKRRKQSNIKDIKNRILFLELK
jgi:hypothetical protein